MAIVKMRDEARSMFVVAKTKVTVDGGRLNGWFGGVLGFEQEAGIILYCLILWQLLSLNLIG